MKRDPHEARIGLVIKWSSLLTEVLDLVLAEDDVGLGVDALDGVDEECAVGEASAVETVWWVRPVTLTVWWSWVRAMEELFVVMAIVINWLSTCRLTVSVVLPSSTSIVFRQSIGEPRKLNHEQRRVTKLHHKHPLPRIG